MDNSSTMATVFDSYYDMTAHVPFALSTEPEVPMRVRRRSITDFSDVALYQDCVGVINKVVIAYVQRSLQEKNVSGAIEFVMTTTLEALFSECKNDHSKRFLYYMVSNQECGTHLRNNHGIWLTGQPRGNRSTLAVNRDHLVLLSHRSEILLDAWKRHKLLSKIMYNF